MTRRSLLKVIGSALAASSWLGYSPARSDTEGSSEPGSPEVDGKIMTVTAPVEPATIGAALPHEHVFHRFGQPSARYPAYELGELFETVVPILNEAQSLGCTAIMDCTAAYFGRDPLVMHRLAELTGMHLVTNTGYYAAADDRYVPDHAYDESAEQLANRWLEEWHDGIAGTGVRPGFIKVAVDGGALSEIDRKLIRAAAKTHRESGLTIAAHTSGNVPAAREQLTVLNEEGVDPSAWIWVHAHNVDDYDALAEVAEQGAWIEFDGLEPGEEVQNHLELVQAMAERNLLDRVLLSHDATSYAPDGGDEDPFGTLFRTFTPKLRSAGLTEQTIKMLTVENPRRAFSVQIRT